MLTNFFPITPIYHSIHLGIFYQMYYLTRFLFFWICCILLSSSSFKVNVGRRLLHLWLQVSFVVFKSSFIINLSNSRNFIDPVRFALVPVLLQFCVGSDIWPVLCKFYILTRCVIYSLLLIFITFRYVVSIIIFLFLSNHLFWMSIS